MSDEQSLSIMEVENSDQHGLRSRLPNGADERSVVIEMPEASRIRSK